MKEILHKELSYKINGILFKVHNKLGRFRNEKQYSDAIEEELKIAQIPYKREFFLEKSFVGEANNRNKIDFMIDNKIILEVKAKSITTKNDYFQSQRYLHSADYKLGILANFRRQYLKPKRIINADFDSRHSYV
ncbi:MAG: GxxExxY protein [Candidatus Nealsonbacteria bacterium CG23_combo_of_CG06-09_8_20_14_all_36_12]|uniref:GxxExxY protein n=1 Tax=Candidatus Nealsonbacteria bacterium CG23_combo_of_CG06-09_8_20_14_all_36_12 TaxID=1974718 RepID=A0A2G9Z0L0_9BACT|nr:MAG: GxxExxY protein [Candidatus Nealsonbacteria bacterium CG23_combo_of_CG06-09_8_20_14_all_36_12]